MEGLIISLEDWDSSSVSVTPMVLPWLVSRVCSRERHNHVGFYLTGFGALLLWSGSGLTESLISLGYRRLQPKSLLYLIGKRVLSLSICLSDTCHGKESDPFLKTLHGNLSPCKKKIIYIYSFQCNGLVLTNSLLPPNTVPNINIHTDKYRISHK